MKIIITAVLLVVGMGAVVKYFPSEDEVIKEPVEEVISAEQIFENAVNLAVEEAITASSTDIQSAKEKAALEIEAEIKKDIEERVRKELRDRV